MIVILKKCVPFVGLHYNNTKTTQQKGREGPSHKPEWLYWPVDGKYNCSIEDILCYMSPRPRRISIIVQYIILLVVATISHVEWYAPSVASILVPCLKKEKNRHRIKDRYERRTQYTHENLIADLILSEPKYFSFLLRIDGLSFDWTFKAVSPTIVK